MPLDFNGPLAEELLARMSKDAPAPAPAKEDKGVGKLAKILLGAGLGADVATSIYGETKGVTQEANPLMTPFNGINPKIRFPLAAGAEIGGLMLLNKLIGKKHPKIMKAITMATGGSHGATAIKNVGQIRKGSALKKAAEGYAPVTPTEYINPDYFGK